MTKLDLQLGKVEKINADGTIHIRDFRTGSVLYQNIPLEHNAINQQQPVEGQHVLFFTSGGTGDAHQSASIKIVRFYGSLNADKKLVLNSPIDLAPGEGKMVSQTGAMVYTGNGGVTVESMGQGLTITDEDQLVQVVAQNLNIVTHDGFGITKGEDSTLYIRKGTLTILDGQETLKNVTATIAVADNTITISGSGASLTLDLTSGKVRVDAKLIELNGSTPVARKDDTVKVTILAGTVFGSTPSGPVTMTAPLTISGTITSGSTTVQAG